MGQMTIYLDAETERRMAQRAKSQGMSKSKWIARAIESSLANDWPGSVREMAGSWTDAPALEELRDNLPPDRERAEI